MTSSVRRFLGGFKWGTLDRYVIRRFLTIYAVNLVSFAAIFVLVDAVDHLDEFIRPAGSFAEFFQICGRFYWAMLPLVFVQLLGPIVCLSAGLFTVTSLHRNNELVPMLANARSYPRIFLPMLLAALVISAVTFAIEEEWIPRTVSTIHEVKREREGDQGLLNVKYFDDGYGTLIVMNRYFSSERRAEGVTVLPVLHREDAHEFYIQARTMEWVEPVFSRPYWLLRHAVVQEYGPDPRSPRPRLIVKEQPQLDGAPRRLLETFAERRLETDLTPVEIEVRQNEVVYMSLGDLRRKMRDSGDRRWAIKYFSRFSYPLSNSVLLLLGLPVIVFLGGRNIFFGAFVATCVTTAFFVAGFFFTDLATRGFLLPSLGVGLGPILFTALGLTWMRYMRT